MKKCVPTAKLAGTTKVMVLASKTVAEYSEPFTKTKAEPEKLVPVSVKVYPFTISVKVGTSKVGMFKEV